MLMGSEHFAKWSLTIRNSDSVNIRPCMVIDGILWAKSGTKKGAGMSDARVSFFVFWGGFRLKRALKDGVS
jgi:hypothetical protein